MQGVWRKLRKWTAPAFPALLGCWKTSRLMQLHWVDVGSQSVQEMDKAVLGKKRARKGLKGQQNFGQNETLRVADHVCRGGSATGAASRDGGWKVGN